MKKIIVSVLCLTLACVVLKAQTTEESRVMALGNQNAIILPLEDASSSFVEKTWKDYMKKYGKVKKVKKSNELVVADAQVLDIGGTQLIDLYARAEESGDGSNLLLWVDLNGEFVNSDDHSDAYYGGVALLEDFAHRVKVDMIAIELEEQTKVLDKLESKMKKLKKDNDGYHKTIEQAKARIAKAEEDIAKNLQDQELTSQEIGSQSEVVEDVRRRLDAAREDRGSGS